MESIASPRLETCELNSRGHNSGYNRSGLYGTECRVLEISDEGYLLINSGGVAYTFWNHNPLWCRWRISRAKAARINVNTDNHDNPMSATLFVSESESWSSWTRISLAVAQSPCQVQPTTSVPTEPSGSIETASEELDPEDPLSIQWFFEEVDPNFEIRDDGYLAYGWEFDDEWFVRVIGPDGFFDTSFRAGLTEIDAREMAQEVIDSNLR